MDIPGSVEIKALLINKYHGKDTGPIPNSFCVRNDSKKRKRKSQ
jgi:hypothetical protein